MKKSLIIDYSQTMYRLLPRAGAFLANLGISAMAILVAANAILRYVFGQTPRWGDEICAFLIVFVVFLGAGSTMKDRRHIRVTAVIDKLPSLAQNIIQAIYSLIALFYIGYLIYSTTQLALMSLELHAQTMNGVPLFPLQIWLPIGLLMLFFVLVGFTLRTIAIILHSSRNEK